MLLTQASQPISPITTPPRREYELSWVFATVSALGTDITIRTEIMTIKKLTTALVMLLMAASASALTLSEAKNAHFLGEQPDGYLGVVNANADAKLIMLQVNRKRSEHFKKIADRNGTTVGRVAVMAGHKFIAKTRKGNYIKTQSGQWLKK